MCARVCRAGPTFNPFLSRRIPSPQLRPPALTTPPQTPSPPPRAQPQWRGLCPLGRPDRRSLPPHSPPARRPRVRAAEGGWGGGASSAPGPYCGPFKSRPLNPFSSADRNCRPSPLGGRDHAAPSPTAGQAPGPQSAVPGPGKGLPRRCGLSSGGGGGKGATRGAGAGPFPSRPARANCPPTSRRLLRPTLRPRPAPGAAPLPPPPPQPRRGLTAAAGSCL